jgi:hypothetical protein
MAEFLFYFLFQTPRHSERVATFAGDDESPLFHRLDGIAIGGRRAYSFIIFQPPQNSAGIRPGRDHQGGGSRLHMSFATVGSLPTINAL